MNDAHAPMNDEQRQRWKATGLFPIERWDTGPDATPLACPIPTVAELRTLAAGVPDRIQLSGWYASKPRFGSQFLYADNFAGMGRQHIASLPAGRSYFGTLPEYMAACSPRTVLRLLDRIAELERQLTQEPAP